MAMNAARLGNARAAALIALLPAEFAPSVSDEMEFRTAIIADSQEIIDEIVGFAEVTTTVTGTLPTGPEAASGSGSVTS